MPVPPEHTLNLASTILPPRTAAATSSSPLAKSFTAFGLIINWIIGVGILSLPHAGAAGGLAAMATLIIAAFFINLITVGWIVEASGRAESIITARFGAVASVASVNDPLLSTGREDLAGDADAGLVGAIHPRRQFEVTHLLSLFGGSGASRVYAAAAGLFMGGALWLFAAVFGSSVAAFVPAPYRLACELADPPEAHKCTLVRLGTLAGFAALNCILAMRGIAGVAKLQAGLTIFMLILLVVMGTTATVQAASRPWDNLFTSSDILGVRPAGFAELFPTIVFAFMCQQGAPAFIHVMHSPRSWPRIFGAALACLVVLYIWLSTALVLLFGRDIMDPITLEWNLYPWGASQSGADKVLGLIVNAFPIISTAAAFPIYAISLADTWLPLMPRAIKASKVGSIVLRIACVLVPVALAAVMSDVSKIIVWPGLFGFVLAFAAPAYLQLRSMTLADEVLGTHDTPYTMRFGCSSRAAAYMVLGGAIIGMGYCLFVNVDNLVSPTPTPAPVHPPHHNFTLRHLIW
eukprot:CAMPEP_0170748556 /NCGR_PEP_ID=MMETSP0437-20130122/9928_1 /TAXON_ID=0 /ORGANISM="Sexangularia sp." /LENGTH=519 /DNA_ID=CAMNT_0011087427 /DNA_START=21 /DNA_END=1580 /DNA_ORIENTATION=-